MYPCPPQDEGNSGILIGRQKTPSPGNQTQAMQSGRVSLTQPSSGHTDGRVLAEPFNNTKKHTRGQTDFVSNSDGLGSFSPLSASLGRRTASRPPICPPTARVSCCPYSTDCTFHAPFSRAKSAVRFALSRLPGMCARSCTGCGTPAKSTLSMNGTVLVVSPTLSTSPKS